MHGDIAVLAKHCLFLLEKILDLCLFLGKILELFFASNPINAMIIGGISMGIGAITTIFVVSYKKSTTDRIMNVASGH